MRRAYVPLRCRPLGRGPPNREHVLRLAHAVTRALTSSPQVVREMLTRLARSHIGGPNKGLGAYAYNVENTVLGSRGLDDWAYFNQTKPMQRDAFTPFH